MTTPFFIGSVSNVRAQENSRTYNNLILLFLPAPQHLF